MAAARPPRARRSGRSRGTGTLAILLILLLGAALLLLYGNRALLFELRSAANLVHSVQAFEAAEAGRAWLPALLNQPGEVDPACQPVPSAGAASANGRLRSRYLSFDMNNRRIDPAVGAPLPGCLHEISTGWRCSCPTAGPAVLTPAVTTQDSPAFGAQLGSITRAGLLGLDVSGCSLPGPGCAGSARPDASARVQLQLATLAVLARPPAATLTSGANLTLGSGVLVANPDSDSGGLTLDAGGALQLASDVRLLGPAGSPGGSAGTIAADPRLQATDAALFAATFALDRTLYRLLPNLRRLDCRAGCSAADVQAARADGSTLLWLDGDLDASTTSSTQPWGSATEPLQLIVDGQVRLDGPLQFTGLLHARGLRWNNAGATAGTLRGALVSTGELQLGGPLQLQHDSSVLAALQLAEAALLPVPGSWHDFDN